MGRSCATLVGGLSLVLCEDGEPVLPGALAIKAGPTGEFHIGAGVDMVRYRHKDSCEVRRGGPLELTGPPRYVEVSVEPSMSQTGRLKMRKVSEPL